MGVILSQGKLQCNLIKSGILSVSLVSLNGKSTFSIVKNLNVNSGESFISIKNFNEISSGTYILKSTLSNSDGTTTIKSKFNKF